MRHLHRDEEDTVTIMAVATQETAKALAIKYVVGAWRADRAFVDVKEKWVPKSVIHDDSEVFDKTHTTPAKLVVLGWWARKEGLE